MRSNLLFIMAASFPFISIGPLIAQGFWVTPALVVGTVYGLYSLKYRSVRRLFIGAAAMVFVFAVTAVPRHDPSSYLPSIVALITILLLVAAPIERPKEYNSMLRGFLIGWKIVVAILFAEVLLQIVGATGPYELLTGLFRDANSIYSVHNQFLGYFRPYGTMQEPAHLALYLCASFVIFDLSASIDKKNMFCGISVVGIFLVGSVSGWMLLFVYIFFKAIYLLGGFGGYRKKRFLKGVSLLLVCALVLMVVSVAFREFGGAVFEAILHISQRLDIALGALTSGKLTGSEGSRVNAFLALPAYWADSGILGFIFGTGYSNYSDWLQQRFEIEGSLSSLARGDVNNILVAVFLSTGVIGLFAYCTFLMGLFKMHRTKVTSAVAFFVFAFHFVYGTLVSYFFWYLLFMLLACSKYGEDVYRAK